MRSVEKQTMSTYWLVAGLAMVVVLSACSIVSGGNANQAHPQRYTLPASNPAAQGQPSRHFPVVLQIAGVDAPAWLSSPRMIYQLDYQKQGQLAAYTQSRWAASPPAMLSQKLQDALADSGAFKAVTGAGDIAADIVLQVDLTDFSQRFVTPKRSYGVLDARATLVAPGTDHVLAQRNFHYQMPAPSANAAGGVIALGNASSRFAAAIGHWMQHTLSQCAPGCLPSSAS